MSPLHTTCRSDGTYVLSDSVVGDGTYAVRIAPSYANGTEISSAVISKSIEVDTTIPAAPIITTVSHVTLTSSFTLNGTTPSPDTVLVVQSDTSGSLLFSALAFSSVYNLTAGQTKTYTFFAKDFAGNISAGTSFTMSFLAVISLIATDFSGVANNLPISDGGGGGSTLEATTGSPFILSVNPKVGSDGTRLTTGITRIAQ